MKPCTLCTVPQSREVTRRLNAGESYSAISLWLASVGVPVHRSNVQRHAQNHVRTAPRTPGKKPPSTDFLTDVRDMVHTAVAEGELPLTVRDGLAAQQQLDHRAEKSADRDLMVKIALALTGSPPPLIEDPDYLEIEGEFAEILSLPAESGMAQPQRPDPRRR